MIGKPWETIEATGRVGKLYASKAGPNLLLAGTQTVVPRRVREMTLHHLEPPN